MNRLRWLGPLCVFLTLAMVFGVALAQDSQAAKATRKKLQQQITIDVKEIGTKEFFEELNRELEKPITFKIDNTTGLSNNSKMTVKAKNVTVEKLLNDVCDKYDFGYVIISNASNNKVDGSVVLRKSSKGKERGNEAGKEEMK